MAQRQGLRPNILWISTHDINPDLGCYAGIWPGAETAHTPNLDRLAAEGIRYDRALSTTPVCGPARSALITGMYPTAIGTMHHRTRAVPPPDVRPIPEILRRAGYYCTSSPTTDYQFQTPVTVFDDFGPQAHWRNRPHGEQPFFALLHSGITHESRIYLDDDDFARHTHRLTASQRHDPAAATLPPYFPDTPEFRQAVARYHDNITAMDYWAGKILDQLAEDGLAENTLVVFWSDHGAGFPRHKRWPYESGLRVPLLMRWPQQIAPGTVISTPTCTMDVAATTLAVAGVPLPDALHARPLVDAQGRPAPPRTFVFGHRDRMDEVEETVRTVHDGRFQYLRNHHPDRPYLQHQEYADSQMATWQCLRRLHFQEAAQRLAGAEPNLLTREQRLFMATTKPHEELYDLLADPFQIRNLAGDPAYTQELDRLQRALDDWQQHYPDLGLMDEADLWAIWWPQGTMPQTAAPRLSCRGDQLLATCDTQGAVIGWTADPPPPNAADATALRTDPGQTTGNPPSDGRHWQIYAAPLPHQPGRRRWFRAHRLGYRESDEVTFAES